MKYFKIEDNQISGFYDSEIHGQDFIFTLSETLGEDDEVITVKELKEGFYEISNEEHTNLLNLQSQGYALCCKLDGTLAPRKLMLGETWDGIDTTVDLIPLKEKLKKEITNHRDALWETNFVEYEGRKQRYRLKDSTSMSSVRSDLVISQAEAQEEENKNAILEEREPKNIILTEEWYFWEGQPKNMTIKDINDLGELIKPALREMYRREATLKYMVDQIADMGELEKFDIATMWNII